MKTETVNEALRAAPPVGVGGLTFLGIYLNEWVLLATLVYTLFLIVDKLPVVFERLRSLCLFVKKWRNPDVKSK